MPMARDGKDRPYVKILLSDELQLKLDEKKQQTGNSYATIVRLALGQYLSDVRVDPENVEKVPRSMKEVFPQEASTLYKTEKKEDIGPIREALEKHYIELIGQLKRAHGGELKAVRQEILTDITKNEERFKQAGYPLTLNAVTEIILRNTEAPASLKDYARMVTDEPTRTRPKKDKARVE